VNQPLTQEDLGVLRCANPDCAHDDHCELVLHSRCHPTAGVNVHYLKASGTLLMKCRQCHKRVTEIEVAL
jgi:hypothetical protein